MTRAESLAAQFGHSGEHPSLPRAEWRMLFRFGDTPLGYWDWVDGRLPAPSKVWYIGLRATATVIAPDKKSAVEQWEQDNEFDVTIDTEGGPDWIEEADDLSVEEARKLRDKLDPREALTSIHRLLSGKEWDSDTACRIAEVIMDAGCEIKDFEQP